MTAPTVRELEARWERPFPTLKQLEVMGVIHDRDEATVRQIKDTLEDELAYTSVLTVCQTLDENGWLEHRRSGKRYLYALNVDIGDLASQIATGLATASPRVALEVGRALQNNASVQSAAMADYDEGW